MLIYPGDWGWVGRLVQATGSSLIGGVLRRPVLSPDTWILGSRLSLKIKPFSLEALDTPGQTFSLPHSPGVSLDLHNTCTMLGLEHTF